MRVEKRIPWVDVQPLGTVNGELQQVLASVDNLREAWKVSLAQVSKAEFAEARRRSLRRHAIETGIIERLYDVDWSVTEALVAEGITAEVAARQGGLDDDALTIISSQYDALEFLADAARDGRDLSLHFIRELHHAVCRAQATYEARNDFGQVLQVPLHHGTWKTQPNHVRRQDGMLLEYTPAEHVQSQMERMLELYRATAGEHPGALDVAHAYAQRLRALQQVELTERAAKAEALAAALHKEDRRIRRGTRFRCPRSVPRCGPTGPLVGRSCETTG